MGNQLTADQLHHVEELHSLTQKSGCPVPYEELKGLIEEISHRCAWYPEAGSLNQDHWHKIGLVLHQQPQACVQNLQAWHKCRFAIDLHAPKASEEEDSPLSLTTEPPNCLFSGSQLALLLAEVPSLQSDLAAPPDPDLKSECTTSQVMLEQQPYDHCITQTEVAVKIANPLNQPHLVPVASLLPPNSHQREKQEPTLTQDPGTSQYSKTTLQNSKEDSVTSMSNLVSQASQNADPEVNKAKRDLTIAEIQPGTLKILRETATSKSAKNNLNIKKEVTLQWPKQSQIQNTEGKEPFPPGEISCVLPKQDAQTNPKTQESNSRAVFLVLKESIQGALKASSLLFFPRARIKYKKKIQI